MFPKSLTADACLAALWHVVIIVVAWIISDIFRVVTTNKTGQNVSLFLNLVSNGDVKADLNGQSISFFRKTSCRVANKLQSERKVYRELIGDVVIILQSTFTL